MVVKKLVNDFASIFKNLSDINKTAINAYRSGREFKNLSNNPFVLIDKRVCPTILASICNKLFACELFLKSIIIINKNFLQKGHKISYLIKESGIEEILEKELVKYNLKNEIAKIDNAFQIWQYSYEYDNLTINSGFLNDLCQSLEKICRQEIQKNYQLNMLDSFI